MVRFPVHRLLGHATGLGGIIAVAHNVPIRDTNLYGVI